MTFPFLLLLLGAERAYAISDEPIQGARAATAALATAAAWLLVEPQRVLEHLRLAPEVIVEHLNGFDLSLLAAGDPAGIAPGRLMHRVEAVSELSLATAEADIVFSLSWLEHLHPVPDALESLRRITKPGGLGIHVVDLIDHGFYSGEARSPHEFLETPATEALVRGCNRLRCDEWIALFEQHGFQVERTEQWSTVPPPSDAEHTRFAEPYRSMSLDTLTTSGARLFVRREGRATTRAGRRVRPASDGDLVRPHLLPATDQDPSTPSASGQAYRGLVATAAGARAAEFVSLADSVHLTGSALVKLVAFYLPQFHPIPENDAWWGKGFTEWTNVSKAVPQFVGHYQPHLPGELGFYDLRGPEVQQRQVELARLHGISGFCFYYYWFGGTRLLERPLAQFMSNPAIDFPFCICWANENWTRRWDGHEGTVLIAQDHTDTADAAFIADIEPVLRHPNYIRIDGRPVLLVYRPGLLRDPAATASRWREHCKVVGLADPYLVATEAFDIVDPRTIGFDAAVEFPPNTGGRPLPADIASTLSLANPEYAGAVYRYADMWRDRLDRPSPAYELFRAVCPGFDNEARRPGSGSTYAFSSPSSYGRWLEAACRTTLAKPEPDTRLVFINAWNEWAEGAHLEPDRRFGYAYLSATAKALDGLRHDWTLLVISHDACRGGAQLVLLEYLTWLARHTSIRLKVICLESGEWLPRFQTLADTVLLSELQQNAARGDLIALHIVSRQECFERLLNKILRDRVRLAQNLGMRDVVEGDREHLLSTLGVLQANGLEPGLTNINTPHRSVLCHDLGLLNFSASRAKLVVTKSNLRSQI